MERKISHSLYQRAKGLMPGGVSSPVRAFSPYPSYIERGEGSRIVDVDGNEMIDHCMGYGPLILGHAHPEVVAAVREQAGRGTLYGAPIEAEVRMAEIIRSHYPSVDMVRMVNTGTEATMHAIRLARGYTGKKRIVKIEGAFHGAHDTVLVKAGSGATTHSAPDSLGIPPEVTANTLLAPFNDLDAVRGLIGSGDVAAVILEPVIGNAGQILPDEGYLEGMRELTEENDALLIFDEVITGFRLAMGGAQERFGVVPDMTVLGKIAGGGLPMGIFAGREDIMSMVSPSGKVYQAGTFSGNPLSLAAGLATLEVLRGGAHAELERKGDAMRSGLRQVVDDLRLPYRVQGIASMFQLFMTDSPVRDYGDAMRCDAERFHRLFLAMLERGVYLPPSQYETNFISTAHSDGDIALVLEAFGEALREVTG